MALQLTLPVATDGYLYPGPTRPLSIATSGYLALVLILEEKSSGARRLQGAQRQQRRDQRADPRLQREDDEMMAIFMMCMMYNLLDQDQQ